MFDQKAGDYYFHQGKSCAEGVLLAASEAYGLNITESEAALFAGFRTGMGCGSTCGGLTGAIGVLSRMYGHRPDFKTICADFVAEFKAGMGCGSLDCEPIAAQYKTEAARCTAAVQRSARLLQQYIDRLEGRTAAPTEGCTLTADQIKQVKGMGFLQHKGTNKFNARVITRNGRITTDEAAAVAEAARQYGDGHMMMTTRLTIEVSGIDYKDIPAFQAKLAEAGLETGGTGSKVRPVVSCKGTTCQYGLTDTYRISQTIHEKFYKGYRGVNLPHKFKIAVGGCPNNCVKPDLNDLGIIGARVLRFDPALCRGCSKCGVEAACPVKAAKLEHGKLSIDPAACNNCGRCVGKCPFGSLAGGEYGWKVTIGGRWGKQASRGQLLDKLITDEAELYAIVEKAILLFRAEGKPGERFADTLARIGFDRAQQLILSDELLARKADILGVEMTGGATC